MKVHLVDKPLPPSSPPSLSSPPLSYILNCQVSVGKIILLVIQSFLSTSCFLPLSRILPSTLSKFLWKGLFSWQTFPLFLSYWWSPACLPPSLLPNLSISLPFPILPTTLSSFPGKVCLVGDLLPIHILIPLLGDYNSHWCVHHIVWFQTKLQVNSISNNFLVLSAKVEICKYCLNLYLEKCFSKPVFHNLLYALF